MERPQGKPSEKKINEHATSHVGKSVKVETHAHDSQSHDHKDAKSTHVESHSHEGHNHDHSHDHKDHKPTEHKEAATKDDKVVAAAPKVTKKEEAFARGENMHASKKHCMYICEFIKGKTVDKAIADLHRVVKKKMAVPFRGEIPHRKGMMSGRYPVKVAGQFINILKGLRGNIIVNGLDLENAKIYFAMANWAARPAKKGGMRFKRANVLLKAKELKQGDKK